MLRAGLVLFQRRPGTVKTEEGKLVTLAPFDGIRHGRPADDQLLVLDAGEILQLFQFRHKIFLVRGSDAVFEFEEDCTFFKEKKVNR